MIGTMLMTAAAVFTVAFFRVFQQKNSAGMHYRWVPLSQYGIHCCEAVVMGVAGVTAVESGSILYTMLVVGVPAGTGGTVGALSSMWVHNRWVSK